MNSTILIADDDRIIRTQLCGMLEDNGYQVVQAADGKSAYRTLMCNTDAIEVALIDRTMPGLDGLSLVRIMKQNARLANMPIIIVTGLDKPEDVREGLTAGVFYYLTKPVEQLVVNAVVGSAVEESRRRRSLHQQLQGHNNLSMLNQGLFTFTTSAQAESLALQLAPLFPQPERTFGGIHALLLNAVEHGLLGIGYATKGELLAQGTFAQEVERREALPENRNRPIRVVLERLPTTMRLTIADPGEGFDWHTYLHSPPEQANTTHGHGIAQARGCGFENLSYSGKGNVVQAQASLPQEQDC